MDVVNSVPVKDGSVSHIPHPTPSHLIHGLTERVGTTALTAIVDAEADAVHIINLGDCRAVAGWLNPATGLWRAEVLNSEHSASNPDEQSRQAPREQGSPVDANGRLYHAHPGEEEQAIITEESGPPMLMGFADVFRVFGDSHLKRTANESKK